MNLLHRTESSGVNSYIYGQLIFDHVPKHFNNGKYNLEYIILEQERLGATKLHHVII